MSKFASIGERAAELAHRAEAGQVTARDVAELMELYQQAIDGIDELIDNQPVETPLIARLDGQTALKFDRDAEALAQWITGAMER